MEVVSANNFDYQVLVNLMGSLSFNVQALVGAFVIWIFSWLWHDFIIVKPWLKWTEMSLDDAKALHEGKLNQDLGLYLVSKIILSYICMLLSAALYLSTFIQFLILAAAISFGIVFTSGVGPVIFENRHVGLWFLSSILISISVFMLLILQYIFIQYFG